MERQISSPDLVTTSVTDFKISSLSGEPTVNPEYSNPGALGVAFICSTQILKSQCPSMCTIKGPKILTVVNWYPSWRKNKKALYTKS